MDPDSFLNLLTPELSNIDYDSLYYCESSAHLDDMKYEDRGEGDVVPLIEPPHRPSIAPITQGQGQLAPSLFCDDKTHSPVSSAFGFSKSAAIINPGISIPSPPFASVLKLSDIACALEGFSQPAIGLNATQLASHASRHRLRHSYASGAQFSYQHYDNHPTFSPPFSPSSTKTSCTALQPLPASRILIDVEPDSGSDRDVKSFPVTSTHAPHPTSPFYPKQAGGSGDKRPRLSPEAPSRDCASTDETDQKRPPIRNTFRREGMTPREVHIQSERQRRRSMTDHFATLQTLIPKLKLRHSDRITVLTEVITYIQSLRATLDELEKKKTDLLSLFGLPPENHLYYDSPSTTGVKKRSSKHRKGAGAVEVSVRMTGSDIFLTVNSPKKKGVWSKVLLLLHRHSIEVVNTTLASSGDNNFHCIHGKMGSVPKITASDLQKRLEQLIWIELKGRPKL